MSLEQLENLFKDDSVALYVSDLATEHGFIEEAWDELGEGETTEHTKYYQIRKEHFEAALEFVGYCTPRYLEILSKTGEFIEPFS